MDIPVLALWFVCGLGTAVLAASAPLTRTSLAGAAVAFVVGAWWSQQPFAPSIAAVALGTALVAARELLRPAERASTLAVAGLLAGAWAALLRGQGLPTTVAIPVAVTVPAAAAYLRVRRPGFAPPALREEALLFLIVLGLAAAATPGVVDGWRAAGTLNMQPAGTEAPTGVAMPLWTLYAASAALVSGGLFSIWSRR